MSTKESKEWLLNQTRREMWVEICNVSSTEACL